MYMIRDRNGEAKAKISNDIANKVMRDTRGQFREMNFKSGKKTVFVFTEDVVYGTEYAMVMIWKGDRLIPYG